MRNLAASVRFGMGLAHRAGELMATCVSDYMISEGRGFPWKRESIHSRRTALMNCASDQSDVEIMALLVH